MIATWLVACLAGPFLSTDYDGRLSADGKTALRVADGLFTAQALTALALFAVLKQTQGLLNVALTFWAVLWVALVFLGLSFALLT